MRFLCDAMLGKLGRWLRMFGYDTLIATDDLLDEEIRRMAREQDRVLLTRDKGFRGKEAYYIEEKDHKEQLKKVIGHFKLKINFPESSRCSTCNGELEETDTGPPEIKAEQFWICKECGKYYWKGSHWNRILKIVEEIKKSA